MSTSSSRRSLVALLVASVAGVAGVRVASAAPLPTSTITWGTAQNMTGDADILSNGTYFDAITMNTSNITDGGVTFVSPANSGSPATDGTISVTYSDDRGQYATFSATSPSSTTYSNLVSSGAFNAGGSNLVTITGLTTGDSYQVQSWSFFTGDSVAATTTYDGTVPVSVHTNPGQFAVGTFTASGATETYNFTGSGGHGFINAVSVRDISGGTVPEPASLSLLAVGGLIMLRRRRR